MSDVVLKDENHDDVTFEDVQGVALSSSSGGTITFVREDLIPQTDYEQTNSNERDFLKNKPFGFRPDVLSEATIEFSQHSDYVSLYSASLELGESLVAGESYTVTIDGTTYELIAKDAQDLDVQINGEGVTLQGIYLGNSYLVGCIFGLELEDTGETFCITDESCMTSNVTDTSHVIKIVHTNNIQKLDKKWLPDGLATEDFVNNAISNIDTSGSSSIETDILSKQDLSFVTAGETLYYWAASSYPTLYPNPKLFELTVGETYYVDWDGTVYACVAASGTFATVAGVGLGNFALAQIGEDTGEPFLIGVWDDGTDTACYATDTSDTHTVRIYQTGTTVQPDYEQNDSAKADYIKNRPFYTDTVPEEVISETEMTFSWTDPDYICSGVPTSELLTSWLGDWETATVVWDGISYDVQAKNYMGVKCVGNLDLLLSTGDTGEPFIIMMGDASIFGSGTYVIASTADETPEDTTDAPTINHTVSVTLDKNYVKKIEDKFLPQTSWTEADESSASFIKDRPFYSEPIGTVIYENTITTAAIDGGSAIGAYILPTLTNTCNIDEHTYTVVFDDVEYTCTAIDDGDGIILGNDSLLSSDGIDTGEPFGFDIASDFTILCTETEGDHTIKIALAEEIVHKLDSKYLPDFELSEEDKEEIIEEIKASGTQQTPLFAKSSAADSNAIPQAVIDGVSDLVDKALSRADKNVLRFVIYSDAHHKTDNTDITNGNIELGQAVGEVVNQIGVDFVSNIGDSAWASYANTAEEVREQIKQFNRYVYPYIKGEQILNCEGNHDDAIYSTIDNDGDGTTSSVEKLSLAETFSLIYAHNKNVVYDTDHYIDGYCYKDFDHLKVRVICLNTEQGTGEGGVIEGYQLKWLAETALNMTDKTDWNVITLAHHPLSYPSSTLKDSVNIIDAFINGDEFSYTTQDGTKIVIDYNEKNCQYVGHFHGHAHAFSAVKMQKYDSDYVDINAWEICIPNACYTRSNQYLGNASERLARYSTDTTYEKSNEDGLRTSFNLVTVDLDNKIIYADNYGAGIDRTVSYAF